VKIAVISDIHANLEALTAVVSDARENGADKMVCLGDVIGYGANPNECLEIVKAECEFCLVGNHEAAISDTSVYAAFNDLAKISIDRTCDVLTQKARKYLASFEMLRVFDGDFTAVHATPFEPHLWRYISDMDDAIRNFDFFDTKFCFIGHTHIPSAVMFGGTAKDCRHFSVLPVETINYGSDFGENTKFIVNVGSVGQPRDKNPKASYVLIDTDAKTLRFMRISYDIERYQQKMRDAGMPDFLTKRVADGF